jgi:hypothetical protein
MCVITLKEGEKERKKERRKERAAYHYRELGWDRACMLQQQVEVEVVHMVDMLAEKKKRKRRESEARSSSSRTQESFRCDIQLALAKKTNYFVTDF